MRPEVSVVIPTYNSARTVAACVRSLFAQSYRAREVIVVDNYSGDMTEELARTEGARVLALHSGRSAARNYGAKVALGRYFLHLDSDMLLDPGAIEECVNLCEGGHFDAAIIPEVSVGKGYWSKCDALHKELVRGVPGREAARFFAAKAFTKVGGYDEHLESGEDFDLQYRADAARLRICRTNSVIYHDVGSMTLRNAVDKYKHYGRTVERFRTKHESRLVRDGSFGSLMLARRVLLQRDPIHTVGFLILTLFSYITQKG